MCSCLKRLPCGFADRAGAVCKTGGGGGKEERVALGPIRAFPSRRWEFSSKAAGARARSQSSSGAHRKSLARPLLSLAPGWDQPAPRRAMNRLPQLVLWVTTVGKELIFLPLHLLILQSPSSIQRLNFTAPSLLPLKPEKHYFQNSREKSREKEGGGWGVKVLA